MQIREWQAADSPESRLVGDPIQQHSDRFRNASPLTWVTPDDAPVLIMHGTHDDLVPYQQSVDFHGALKKR